MPSLRSPFAGNPAAVCLLERERESAWMQSVAAEMNLSETAFVRRLDSGFELRWFTPGVEVDLCGHATLAAAHVMWQEETIPAGEPIAFSTRSGVLTATRAGELIEIDFPSTPPVESQAPEGLLEALGVQPTFVGRTKFDYLVVVDGEQTLRSIRPDFRRLAQVATRGVIVTSLADNAQFDFVSRFFAPGCGVDEDPVTGSAHCALHLTGKRGSARRP